MEPIEYLQSWKLQSHPRPLEREEGLDTVQSPVDNNQSYLCDKNPGGQGWSASGLVYWNVFICHHAGS